MALSRQYPVQQHFRGTALGAPIWHFSMPTEMLKAELSILLLLTIPPGAEADSLAVLPNVEVQ